MTDFDSTHPITRIPQPVPALDDLIGDLTRDQLVTLIGYMWTHGSSRGTIKGFRRLIGLPKVNTSERASR